MREQGATPKSFSMSAAKRRKVSSDDNGSIDAIVADFISIEDINSDPNGTASKAQDKSARKQFVKFLGNGVTSFDSIPKSILTKSTVGKFCNYMLQNPGIGYQTSMNYLSCIRRQIEKTYKVTFFKDDPIWYKETRKNLTKIYIKKTIEGIKLKYQT